ncbi:MAG: tetratricopeptide repeat protein [Candidatus Helarchaeota archaeon]
MVERFKLQPPHRIEDVLRKAEIDLTNNNWEEAIHSLSQIEPLISKKKLSESKGSVYFLLGENFYPASGCAQNLETLFQYFKNAINYFQKAAKEFEMIGDSLRQHIAKGFLSLLRYISGMEMTKSVEFLETARNEFKTAILMAQPTEDWYHLIKSHILEARTLSILIGEYLIRYDKIDLFRELLGEFELNIIKICDLLINYPEIPDFYLHNLISSLEYCFHWVATYLPTGIIDNKAFLINILDFTKEITDFCRDHAKVEALFYGKISIATFSLIIGVYFEDNQFEKKKYFKNAKIWIKKAEKYRSQIKCNTSLSTYYVTSYSTSIAFIKLGYSSSDFKNVLDELDRALNYLTLLFPKIKAAHMIFSTGMGFVVGSFESTTPHTMRINLSKKCLELLRIGREKIESMNNPQYKFYTFLYTFQLCCVYAILGELIVKPQESGKYLLKAIELFHQISKFFGHEIINNYAFYFYLVFMSRISLIFAKNENNRVKQIYYYQNAIDLLESARAMDFKFMNMENLFLLGDVYYELGVLQNDETILRKAYSHYLETIEFCKTKGYYNLLGMGYANLAKIDDRLADFKSAVKNFAKAIDSFDKAFMTVTYKGLGKQIEKLKLYMTAWHLIETAKEAHNNEEHQAAGLHYQKASQILTKLHAYNYEAPFYNAWSILEQAEDLSKKNDHEKAAKIYQEAEAEFQKSIDILNRNVRKKRYIEDRIRMARLIRVAELRQLYCKARYQIEIARVESQRQNHHEAADLFNKAGGLFDQLCKSFKIKREQDELIAILYFCKAWEYLEKVLVNNNPNYYGISANLFRKASNLFPGIRMRTLSHANSLFCSALEYGSLFDQTTNLNEKLEYYIKIKFFLRESAKLYEEGRFQQDAQWVRAISTFFDGIWNLIQADNEITPLKKGIYLKIAKKNFDAASKLLKEEEIHPKKSEILTHIQRIRNKMITPRYISELIKAPEVTESTIGISAPPCPVEISSPVNIAEMTKRDLDAEAEINWDKQIHQLYLFLSTGVCLLDWAFSECLETDSKLLPKDSTGTAFLIQEQMKRESMKKLIELDDKFIILEYGEYLTGAIIADENLIIVRKKLQAFIEEVETRFKKKIEEFSGDFTAFSKIEELVPKYFSK